METGQQARDLPEVAIRTLEGGEEASPMYEAVRSLLAQFEKALLEVTRYAEMYLAHYPQRTFLILGGVLLVLGWLVLRSKRT